MTAGRTVLVTGASRGLGLEFARQAADAGEAVIATCRRPAVAHDLRALAARHPGSVIVEPLDVTDHAGVDALVARMAGRPIDLLLGNAGDIGPRGRARQRLAEQYIGSLNYVAWRDLLEVNLFGAVKVAEAFLPNVAASRERRIVFVSSTTGSNVEGRHALFPYCSSKAALNKCVTMLALALRDRGITCAAMCPGHVKTELGGQGATVDVTDSVRGMRRVIDALTIERSGSFTRYDGTLVAW
jgi:NAD(P)-dependent dehydrogenase (short-subunit alcohol dehydrogenase family)